MVLGGLFFGFLVGVALMAGFHYLADIRRKARIRKMAGIYLLSLADEVDFKKLCGSNYPDHISFLTFEKVTWLNQMLVKFWPFVVEATEQPAKLALEPMLEMYRPAGISSITLEKFHLGKVPPQIDGVRLQSLQKGQVHMDMEFKWGGEGDVVLNVAVMGTKLPIQLKKLSFFATLRVIIQLSDEIPCISALVVAVLPNPKFQIDYKLKVIGGTAGSIPGLGDMIEDMVNSSVADQLEWPHRIVLPVGDTPADIISDLELKLHGKLRVTVLKATSLKNKERIGKSDPYVRLWVRVLFKKKTKVIDNNLNPVWNEGFDFDVEDTETQTLILQVKDEDIGTDKELGITAISLHDLQPDTEIEVTKKLYKSLDFVRVKDKGDRGSITVRLLYHPYTKEEQEIAMAVEKGEREAREGMANAGVMDAVGGSVKMVGTGGAKLVGNGVGAVGSGVVRASRMVSSGVKRLSSNHRVVNSASATPVKGSPHRETNGGVFRSKEV